jgi:hypothetical protein
MDCETVVENEGSVALDNAFAVTAMHARAALAAPGCAGGRDSGAGAGIHAHGRRLTGFTRPQEIACRVGRMPARVAPAQVAAVHADLISVDDCDDN